MSNGNAAVGLLLVKLQDRLDRWTTGQRLRDRMDRLLPPLTATLVLLVGVGLAVRALAGGV